MFLEYINVVLESLSNKIYVYVILWLLIASGIYFSIKLKFSQIKMIPSAISYMTEKSKKGNVSSFQALMTCTASKVGTANIAGVAIAVVTGGPGAIFWMWIMAIIGSASSVVESTLAQMYKRKDPKTGLFIGGPAYYIKYALGKKKIGVLFACLFIFCYMFAFSALHANNMSTSFETLIPDYWNTSWPLIIAFVFTTLIALVVFGGIYRISFVSSYLVPFMATTYLLLGLYILVTNFYRIPEIFVLIFKDAFDFKSISGGFAGSVILMGIKRGLLSNEAGMGSAPNSAATADTTHPMKQGIMQVLSVCIDTILICSTSAFIILLSKTPLSTDMQGVPLMQTAVTSQVGGWGSYFIACSVVCFAFSAIIGNFGISEPNILFIKNSAKFTTILKAICLSAVALGCLISPKIVWNIADIAMAMLAIVNLISIVCLTDKFMVCYKDYKKQKKAGLNPTFNSKDCGIKNADCWDKT